MQLAPAYGHEMYVDENPHHKSYHPPASGGLAGILKVKEDRLLETYQRWVHTKATGLHEIKTLGRFALSAIMWTLQMLQLSYFAVRGELPPVIDTWRSLSELSVTLGFSQFDSEDPVATGRIFPSLPSSCLRSLPSTYSMTV